MKKLAILSTGVAILAAGVILALTLRPEAEAAGPPTNSHSLFFNQPNGSDDNVFCESSKPYVVYIHVRAINVPPGATIEGVVQFQDGDVYGFTLKNFEAFSTTQAAGGVPGVDQRLVVEQVPKHGTGAGQLSGWMSASSLAGAAVNCDVTTHVAGD